MLKDTDAGSVVPVSRKTTSPQNRSKKHLAVCSIYHIAYSWFILHGFNFCVGSNPQN